MTNSRLGDLLERLDQIAAPARIENEKCRGHGEGRSDEISQKKFRRKHHQKWREKIEKYLSDQINFLATFNADADGTDIVPPTRVQDTMDSWVAQGRDVHLPLMHYKPITILDLGATGN